VRKREGQREYPNGFMTKDLMRGFNAYFESRVEALRVRHVFDKPLKRSQTKKTCCGQSISEMKEKMRS